MQHMKSVVRNLIVFSVVFLTDENRDQDTGSIVSPMEMVLMENIETRS